MELPADMADQIIAHCRAGLPNEACGLLAGEPGRVHRVHLLDNIDPSPVSYTIDPVGHFQALTAAEAEGWDLIGAFHSHVSSPAYPSPTDVERAAEPEWIWLVVGPMTGVPEIRAYHIQEGAVIAQELSITGR